MRRALVALGLVLGSCVPMADVQRTTRTVATALSLSDPFLRAAYEAEQRLCLSERSEVEARACVDRVREKWTPVRDAMRAAHEAWCAVEPEAPTCEVSP